MKMYVRVCSRIWKSLFLLFVWCLYSYCSWVLSDSTIITVQYTAWDSEISWMQIFILLSMGLVQITCSKYADVIRVSVLLPACVILGALPLLLFRHFFTGLMIVQVVHACGLALIVPASSKFYACIYRDEDLNLVFCLLQLLMTCSKEVINTVSLNILESFHVLTIFSWLFIAMLSFMILLNIEKRETSRKVPVYNYSFKDLYMTPLIHKLALSVMVLKFVEEIVTSHVAMRQVFDYVTVPVPSVGCLVSIIGILGGLILTWIFNDNKVIHCFLKIHLFCYMAVALCTIFFENWVLWIVIFILGLYFNTTELYLSGSVAVRVGEDLNNCGAAVSGILNGFGNVGQAIALLVLYVIPDFPSTVVGLISPVLCTYCLYDIQSLKRSISSLSTKQYTI